MSAYPHLKSRPKLSATFLARGPHPHTPHYASQRPRAYLRPRKSSVHTEGQVRRPVPTRHNIFARDGRCIRRHTHTHTQTHTSSALLFRPSSERDRSLENGIWLLRQSSSHSPQRRMGEKDLSRLKCRAEGLFFFFDSICELQNAYVLLV